MNINQTEIEIEQLTKGLHNQNVIDGANAYFEGGRVYGRQGDSGSGKSVFFSMLCGLVRPTAGSIRINQKLLGTDIMQPDSIGVMIGRPAFLAEYTGFQNLQLLAAVRQEISNTNIRKMMDLVKLGSKERRRYGAYTSQMRQRLGIAAAFMEQPEILLLDGATSELDPGGVDMLMDLIRRARERDALILLSDRNEGFLRELSDEIYYLLEGKLSAGA